MMVSLIRISINLKQPKIKNIEIPPISPNLTQKNMIMHTSNSIVRDKQVKRPTSCGKVYKLPLLKLLDEVEESSGESREAVQKAKETLQDTLDSFGVEAKVTDAVTGPRITRIEVAPSPGVRLDKNNFTRIEHET